MTPVLRDGLVLRRWRPSDLDRLASLVTDAGVMARTGGPMRSDEVVGLLDRYLREDDPFVLAALVVENVDDGAFVGSGRIARCREEEGPEIGFLVHPAHQGRGVATRIARALIEIARSTLGASIVYATVDCDHAASLRVLEKAGLAPLRTCRDAMGDYVLLATPAA